MLRALQKNWLHGIYVMRKVRIRTIRGFCCANLGSELYRSRTQSSSAICINEATIDRARLRARSIVGLLPRMAEVWLRDPRSLRADPRFAQQMLGSEVCVRDPRIIAQQNLGWSESVLAHNIIYIYIYRISSIKRRGV